jgi:hypothetical protein
LAKQIWQDIWSVSGATPENCLYTFVELFIFKYLSDLKILKTTNGFDFLMQLYEKDNTADEVLQYYADTIRKKIKELFPYNPIDNTTIINGTIFVSKDQKSVAGYSTVFKKVLNKFKDYGKLENINYDFKSQLFESFLKESISKKNWGQFFTPLKVIRSIEKMANSEIKEGAVICDPACGVGKFLLEPFLRLNRPSGTTTNALPLGFNALIIHSINKPSTPIIEQDDLSEAVVQFNMFKGSKLYYQSSNNRCKVLNDGTAQLFDVRITPLSGSDHIYSTATSTGVFNRTLPDHMFHPGYVRRDAIVMDDGFIYIRTLGYGIGYWGSLNVGLKNWAWDSVDQKVIDKY